jgi:hypothetical protein
MSDAPIPGIKVIKHNAGHINNPDDPSLPYRVDLRLRAPEFMAVAFIGLYGGTEDIVVRATTEEAAEAFLAKYGFRTHPRLISVTVTKPE